MKRLLLATTALIATGAFAAPAQAQLEVTIGGLVSFQAGLFDNDDANSSDRDFQSESEIVVRATAVADNGLQYGARVVLNASTNDDTNSKEVGIYLAGTWGRLELGDGFGASRMNVIAPTVGIGQINGSYDDFIPEDDRGHRLNDRGDHRFTAIDSRRNTKITYYTPSFSGFQAGVSYAPEFSNGEDVAVIKTDIRNTFEFGLGYTGEFSGVMIKLGGNYNISDGGGGVDALNAWSLGGQLGYNGFRIGGGYTSNGDSLNSTLPDDDVSTWNIGATYENGPWGVGISYLSVDFDVNGDSGGFFGSDNAGGEYSAWVVGGTYAIAPGLTVGADLAFYDRNRPGVGSDTDGYVFMTDLTAAF